MRWLLCRKQEPPQGHPECLLNRSFVVTGVLDSLKRDEADDLIKRHGGRVTGSVSGKTTYLLAGTQCGRSKIAQARSQQDANSATYLKPCSATLPLT